MEGMLEFIKSRRSTRKYKTIPVEEEKLNDILEAGRHAPSGGNNQTTHFLCISNQDVLMEMAKIAEEEFAKMEVTPDTYKSLASSIINSKKGGYIFHRCAPVVILTANRIGYGNSMADCSCALENMMLMANALDLGSCWVNQINWLGDNPRMRELLERLGLCEDERVFGGISIGYADTEDGLPPRTPLKRTGNIVTFIR